MHVLVVDDSNIYRTQAVKVIEANFDSCTAQSAINGKVALRMTEVYDFDIIVMDLNMPELDGIATLKELRIRKFPGHVIVFASKTPKSASQTIEALALGASDFVIKPGGDSANIFEAMQQIEDQLTPRIKSLVGEEKASSAISSSIGIGRSVVNSALTSAVPLTSKSYNIDKNDVSALNSFHPEAIVVASSTGGPKALEQFLCKIHGNLKVPMFIAQHMPPMFTKFLAQRMAIVAETECKEAEHREIAKPGTIYIAPGDYHMRIFKEEGNIIIKLDQEEKHLNVRPAADHLFETAVEIYGHHLMGFVLTGMGEDGCRGSAKIKAANGKVAIQDEESSVVWGMPGAVYNSGNYDQVLSIDDCASLLERLLRN